MSKKELAEMFYKDSCNVISEDIVGELMMNDPDDWSEVTTHKVGDSVYIISEGDCGTITKVTEHGMYVVNVSEDEYSVVGADDVEKVGTDTLPMWGYMWSFDASYMNEWLEGHLKEASECGFRIYKSERHGYFFGIDGAGYDFYEHHWIPLYEAYMAR